MQTYGRGLRSKAGVQRADRAFKADSRPRRVQGVSRLSGGGVKGVSRASPAARRRGAGRCDAWEVPPKGRAAKAPVQVRVLRARAPAGMRCGHDRARPRDSRQRQGCRGEQKARRAWALLRVWVPQCETATPGRLRVGSACPLGVLVWGSLFGVRRGVRFQPRKRASRARGGRLAKPAAAARSRPLGGHVGFRGLGICKRGARRRRPHARRRGAGRP